MNSKSKKHTLVLAAAGLLTTTAGMTSSTAKAEQPSSAQDPHKDPGGRVLMSMAQLDKAEQHPDGGWRVRVHPRDLEGIEVPRDLGLVELHLSDEQLEAALEVASSVERKAVAFSIHSSSWVEEMEERLLGGFSVTFNASVCDYTQIWS